MLSNISIRKIAVVTLRFNVFMENGNTILLIYNYTLSIVIKESSEVNLPLKQYITNNPDNLKQIQTT